jgi:hypothetical protein
MKNTNHQDGNDPHNIMKLAEEEWDQTDTRLAKYDPKVNKHRAKTISRTLPEGGSLETRTVGRTLSESSKTLFR